MKKLLFLFLVLSLYLGLHQGHLAIFSREDGLQTTLPYRVALFPRLDQQALSDGIPFCSREELQRLLEDFLS